jgi:hypothetical protein
MHKMNVGKHWCWEEFYYSALCKSNQLVTNASLYMFYFLQMRKAMIDQEYGKKTFLLKYHFDHMVSNLYNAVCV